jgi:membrane-bound lytic murein transglycosylase A
MIAQDTGSAIVGPARADLYFGAGAEAGRVSGRLRHSVRFVILIPKSLDPVARGHAMPLPPARPSAKIAKLFPQTDPLKNQKDQKNAAKAAETPTASPAAGSKDATKTAATAAGAPQVPVAQAVPLPEARPAIAPSRHAWRHRYHRRYRNAR